MFQQSYKLPCFYKKSDLKLSTMNNTESTKKTFWYAFFLSDIDHESISLTHNDEWTLNKTDHQRDAIWLAT